MPALDKPLHNIGMTSGHHGRLGLQGIGHSARKATAGQVQKRRRQQRRGKTTTGLHSEQPRLDGGSGRKANARQHRGGRGLAGVHTRRHTHQERRSKTQTLQRNMARGAGHKDGRWVKEKRDKASRGSHDGHTSMWKCSDQHRLGRSRPCARAGDVNPEEGSCHGGAHGMKRPGDPAASTALFTL